MTKTKPSTRIEGRPSFGSVNVPRPVYSEKDLEQDYCTCLSDEILWKSLILPCPFHKYEKLPTSSGIKGV